jgi:mono/diheme cytochrome c family protein
MSAWSQRAGGPLRDDQLADLANFILNWDKGNDWTIEDALLVRQYAVMPGLGGGEAEVVGEPAGTDVAAILQQIEDEGIVGDAIRGEAIYTNRQTSQLGARLGCAGCHAGGIAGPASDLTWDAVLTQRLNDPDLAGYTPEQYIIESIVLPQNYTVDDWSSSMPSAFGQSMSVQDIADVVLYLRSYSDADHSENLIQPADADSGE